MIEFQYFEGCPNADKTYENLVQLAKEGIIQEEITKIEVPDMDTALKCSFQGSPTILINGVDIYTKTAPKDVHYACRLYSIDGVSTGILSKSFIKKATYQLKQGETQPS